MKLLFALLQVALLLPCLAEEASDPNQLLNLHEFPKSERTVLPVEFVWPEKPGDAAICLWKDDKTAVISYTIDDNCAMNIDWWLKETAERDMKVTWFLVTGGISNSNPAMNGTWEGWKTVLDQGHALESHTITHLGASKNLETWKGLDWEYQDSKKMIEENLPGSKATCLAYPGGGQSKFNDANVAAKYYIAGRGGKGTLNGSQGMDYFDIRATSKPNLGIKPENAFSNADLLMVQGEGAYRGWCVLIYHYVKEADPEIVARIQGELDYYVKHKEQLWCGRFNDVVRYAQQRETATLTVTENTPTRIALTVTDRMDDRYFDFPLSVKVRLPDTWTTVQASQNGQTAAAKLIEHEGGRFAIVDVIPDKGPTVLVP